MSKIRTLIVDDSAFIRQLLTKILSSDPEIEVIGAAEDAQVARQMIKELNPDVLTLDVQMPGMNGIDFLEKIMTLRPMPVVMVSTLTAEGAAITLQALELGAVDFVEKPYMNIAEGMEGMAYDMIQKVKVASKARVTAKQSSPKILAGSWTIRPQGSVVCVGSSTGGVEAWYQIISQFPSDCPPVLLTQHMPPQFTATLAQHLTKKGAIRVCEATEGMRIQAGHMYIAPGNFHLEIARDPSGLKCKIVEGDKINGHIPAVDVLFESASEILGKKAVGVILTGMGRDGAQGLKKMKEAGARTIGQDEKSCIVYGMPKAAFELGAVEKQASLGNIVKETLNACGWH